MIKPTIGRVVWYYKFLGTGKGHEGPHAALVARVWNDSMLNLSVATYEGEMQSHTSVKLIQEWEEVPQQDYCGWMPYQIGQAKKEAK